VGNALLSQTLDELSVKDATACHGRLWASYP
jgi:hypothetical protein